MLSLLFLHSLILSVSGACAFGDSQASSGHHYAETCNEDSLPDEMSILQLGQVTNTHLATEGWAKQQPAGLGAEDGPEFPGLGLRTGAGVVVTEELPVVSPQAHAALAEEHLATAPMAGLGVVGSLGTSLAEDIESDEATLSSPNITVASEGDKRSGAHEEPSSLFRVAQARIAQAWASLRQSAKAMTETLSGHAAFRKLRTTSLSIRLFVFLCLLTVLGVAWQFCSACIGSRQKKTSQRDNDPLSYLYAARAVEARRAMTVRA